MKKRKGYFQTEISRLFHNKGFYFSVMGIVMILFLSANDGMRNMGGSVLSSVLLSSYDAGFLVAFSLASIPYAAAFTDDLEYIVNAFSFCAIQYFLYLCKTRKAA